MSVARGWLSASVVSGKIYAIGGCSFVDEFSTVEEYTPEGLSVSPSGKMPNTWGNIKGR
jgi:hypothetical protein